MPSCSSDPVNFQTDAERFRLLVEAVTDYAIYMLGREGRVITWNAGAERLKGYTAGEIVGQHFRRFFAPEDQQRSLPAQILKMAAANGRHETEGWRVRKDGTRFWALAVVHKVQDKAGRHIGFAKVTRDITERKTAQEALLQSEGRFRILVQCRGIGAALIDRDLLGRAMIADRLAQEAQSCLTIPFYSQQKVNRGDSSAGVLLGPL